MKLQYWAIVVLVFWVATVSTGLRFIHLQMELWDAFLNDVHLDQAMAHARTIWGYWFGLSAFLFVITFAYTTYLYVKERRGSNMKLSKWDILT